MATNIAAPGAMNNDMAPWWIKMLPFFVVLFVLIGLSIVFVRLMQPGRRDFTQAWRWAYIAAIAAGFVAETTSSLQEFLTKRPGFDVFSLMLAFGYLIFMSFFVFIPKKSVS